MDYASNEDAETSAIAFVAGLAPEIERLLGDRLIGVYRIGSLAHAGFSRRYSDVDIAIFAERGLTPADIDAIRTADTELSREWASKLSIFWSDEAFTLGRFPPLDRLDLIEHGVPVLVRRSLKPPRPTLDEIRTYLAGAPFENWSKAAHRFATAEGIETNDRKAYVRAHLYPARFVLSWQTGGIGSNDDAVAYLRSYPPPGLDIGLIKEALRIRQAAEDPDVLFPRRTSLPSQVEACRRLIESVA